MYKEIEKAHMNCFVFVLYFFLFIKESYLICCTFLSFRSISFTNNIMATNLNSYRVDTFKLKCIHIETAKYIQFMTNSKPTIYLYFCGLLFPYCGFKNLLGMYILISISKLPVNLNLVL